MNLGGLRIISFFVLAVVASSIIWFPVRDIDFMASDPDTAARLRPQERTGQAILRIVDGGALYNRK